MPLQVGKEAIFCLDFAREVKIRSSFALIISQFHRNSSMSPTRPPSRVWSTGSLPLTEWLSNSTLKMCSSLLARPRLRWEREGRNLNIHLSFSLKIYSPTQMEKFAAGLLNAGLKTDERILICGNNHSQLVIAALGAARAGLVGQF
jgi:hypothetical protein